MLQGCNNCDLRVRSHPYDVNGSLGDKDADGPADQTEFGFERSDEK